MKQIVVCADGTWNRPEKDIATDFPTNVLKLARAIRPRANGHAIQQVFYDWGVGSYYAPMVGGVTGHGLHKNIVDAYRYIVQNYTPGDRIFLFGFSRGAYTVRCLSGLINNCGILKRPDARLIQEAFDNYKKSSAPWAPSGEKSVAFRAAHAWPSREIHFVGVWDTVGAMGIPFSVLGLLEDRDEFYDTKIGGNVRTARHALAIDELREDFEPTVWDPKPGVNMRQVWFCGAHADVGGSYPPDANGALLADIPLQWMLGEAIHAGLEVEEHLPAQLHPSPVATLHQSRRSFYRVHGKHLRPIDHGKGPVLIHPTVKERWEADSNFRPENLAAYVDACGWTLSPF